MKTLRPCFLLLLFAGFSYSSFGARFWIATLSSNWNNTANWATISGGTGGASVPANGDDVTFDGGGIGGCTIDATVNIKSITVSAGYLGTISQGVNTLTIINSASFSAGVFAGGSAGIIIGGSYTLNGTIFTSTSGVLELDNATIAFTSNTFIHNNGTVRLKGSGTQTVSGVSPVFYALEFVGNACTYSLTSTGDITVLNNLLTSGALFYNINTGVIDVSGDINSANSATGCGGNATININGVAAQAFDGSLTAGGGALPQVTINKTLGTLTLANFPGVSNNFTYTSGTVTPGSSTFCFTHGNVGAYTVMGSLSLTNISFPVNTSLLTVTIPAATTLTATGDLTLAGAGNLVINTGNINVNGNIILTNTGTSGGGSATINVIGTGAENLDGSAVIVNESRLPAININKASGTLSLLGAISFADNVTYTSGNIAPGVSTCYVVGTLMMTGNFSLGNLTLSGIGNITLTIASGSTVTATNTLDLESAANEIMINTGTIAVQGNIVDNNTNLTGGGTGTILINGTGTQTFTSTGVIDQGRLPGVTINKTSGTLVLPALITVRSDWNHIAGTVDVSTNNSTVVFENTMNITGTQTLNNITFDGSNNYTFTTAPATTVTVLGTVSMIGTGNITLATGTYSLAGNLSLTNTGGGGGTTVLDLNGSSNQAITSALPINQNCLPSVTINKSGGTLTFPSLITVRGNWVYTAGMLDVTTNNSTVVFADPLGTGLFGITGSHTLNNVDFEANNNNTLTVPAGTVLTITGTLSTLGTANMFLNTASTNGTMVIQAQGGITIGNTGAGGGGTGLVLINGAGAQLISSSVAASQGWMPYTTIQKTTGTLNLSGIISVDRDWTYSSGTVDAATNLSTVVFGGNNLAVNAAAINFYHLTVASNTTTLSGNLTVLGNLTINGTGILAPGSNTINLAGNWNDRATAGFTESTSTLNFNGSSLQTITCPGGENFTNLTVNSSATGIQLATNAAIATGLTMVQGNIDLNGNTITLGTSILLQGTLTYTAGSMINTGAFTRWIRTAALSGAAGLFPMGTAINNRPFSISSTVSPTTGGTISVAYADAATNSVVSITDGGSTVLVRKDLHWTATTGATLAGGTYSLGISGTGYGTIGAVADLRLVLAAALAGTDGVNAGTVSNPQVNVTGLSFAGLSNSFYPASVNLLNSPLPVTLVYFTAVAANGEVKLAWETSAEMNNDHFTIERSADALKWEDLQMIAGSGNTATVSDYSAVDAHPLAGLSYYRLEQTDRDGKTTFSGIQIIYSDHGPALVMYPNPASSRLSIMSGANIKTVRVFSAGGQEIRCAVAGGGNEMSLDVSELPVGVYYVRIAVDGRVEVTRSFVRK
jgi:fibronectin-binding autotransporter adhesin